MLAGLFGQSPGSPSEHSLLPQILLEVLVRWEHAARVVIGDVPPGLLEMYCDPDMSIVYNLRRW